MKSLSIFRQIAGGIALLVAILAPGNVLAQNDVQLTQYWAAPTYYNPAYTGLSDFINIRLGARLQWVGIDNAPRSFLGAADMAVKLGKKQRMGVGVTAMQESLGLFSNLFINAQASYKFRFLKGVWSVGIQPAYYNTKFKGSDVELPDDDDYHEGTDQAIPTTDVTGSAFDLSAGIMYSHKYFNVGVSCLHILEPEIEFSSDGAESASEGASYKTVLPRQMYFTADGNIPIKNSLFSLQPSMLVRTDFSNFSAEVTMRATYNKFISFGVGYRYKDAVSAMIAAEFNNFFLGYAYDYPISAISKASTGSHEIVAGYRIKLNYGEKNKNKQRSIRIM